MKSRALVFSLEEDDKGNELGLQVRVWMSSSKTKVFVRFFKYKGNCWNAFFDGKTSIEQTHNNVLRILQNFRVIVDHNNWEYSIPETTRFEAMDVFKNEFAKEKTIFFVFKVKEQFLRF